MFSLRSNGLLLRRALERTGVFVGTLCLKIGIYGKAGTEGREKSGSGQHPFNHQ